MSEHTGPDTSAGTFAASRSNGFTIGSLCTGTGGLDLAVEQTSGGEMIWCAEKMDAASRVITARFPGVPNFGDIEMLDPKSLPPVDILTAGYPCQPFSIRGKRLGTADDRHIWPFIANIIDHLRPKAIVLENVRNHLKDGFSLVLQDLADLGFDAEWGIVSAAEAGAPHERKRLFIFAWPANPDGTRPAQGQPGGTPPKKPAAVRRLVPLPGPGAGIGASWTHNVSRYRDRLVGWERATRPAPWPVEGDHDGRACISARFVEWMMGLPGGWVTDLPLGLTPDEQLRLLGNAVVPQAAEIAITELSRRACIAVGIPTAA